MSSDLFIVSKFCFHIGYVNYETSYENEFIIVRFCCASFIHATPLTSMYWQYWLRFIDLWRETNCFPPFTMTTEIAQ